MVAVLQLGSTKNTCVEGLRQVGLIKKKSKAGIPWIVV
jgi:hypothetical protein